MWYDSMAQEKKKKTENKWITVMVFSPLYFHNNAEQKCKSGRFFFIIVVLSVLMYLSLYTICQMQMTMTNALPAILEVNTKVHFQDKRSWSAESYKKEHIFPD